MARDSRNAALERAIIDDPNDLDSYLVYADWLIEQGDPRGELVTAQIAAERGDAAQRRAAIAVFARHRDYFLGALADTVRADAFDWKHGFIHHARLASAYVVVADGVSAPIELATIASELFRHASARFLVKLSIGDDVPQRSGRPRTQYAFQRPESRSIQGVLDSLGAHAPPTLRELVIGEHQVRSHNAANLGRIDAACPRLVNLTDLEINGRCTLDAIALPNLRRAILRPGSLTVHHVRDLARASVPRLESLTIEFGDSSSVGGTEIEPLLRRVDLAHLEHVALVGCGFSNALIKTLATSPLLARIKELDLSDGSLSDQGVRAIAREHTAFRHLELFVVTGNRVTESGMTILRRLNPGVIG